MTAKKNALLKLIRKIYRFLKRLKDAISLSKWRKLIAVIVFGECIFYVRWKYLEYYVSKYIPVNCVQEPVNKHRIMEIRKYARMYRKYHIGKREKWLTDTFERCELSEIKKGNVSQLIGILHFVKYDDAVKSTLSKEEIEWRDNLILETVSDIESEINYRFDEGYNLNICAASDAYQHNKLITFYHPLIMYLFILFGPKTVSNFIFQCIYGFKYKYISGLIIWYKMASNKTVRDLNEFEPIIYFGGVSAGNPGQALMLIFKLLGKYRDNKNLFVIEIPWSEISINHFIPYSQKNYINNCLPLSIDEIINVILNIENMMLETNNISFENNNNKINKSFKCQWTLIAESFGTFICSAIYQKIKGEKLGIIPRLILVDAATLCMTDPTAGRLIGMIEKKNWLKRIFQICVGGELMIATMSTRYMHWMEYCLYPHDLINDGCYKSHIIISGTLDHLLSFKSIKNGINDANKLCNDKNKKIKHIIMQGIPHGIWLIHPYYIDKLIQLL